VIFQRLCILGQHDTIEIGFIIIIIINPNLTTTKSNGFFRGPCATFSANFVKSGFVVSV